MDMYGFDVVHCLVKSTLSYRNNSDSDLPCLPNLPRPELHESFSHTPNQMGLYTVRCSLFGLHDLPGLTLLSCAGLALQHPANSRPEPSTQKPAALAPGIGGA